MTAGMRSSTPKGVKFDSPGSQEVTLGEMDPHQPPTGRRRGNRRMRLRYRFTATLLLMTLTPAPAPAQKVYGFEQE